MPNVTNSELHKLITQFQEDFNARCDKMSKDNADGNKVIAEKIDSFGERLDRFDQRLDRIDGDHLVHAQKFEQIESRFDEVDSKITDNLAGVLNRLAEVEHQLKRQETETSEELKKLRLENDCIKEELENRTNRQLRRTLIFKNIPENKNDESYADVKNLLADIISSYTDISKDEAVAGIERAHREAKREESTREGKRKIFAAFLDWELPQKILDQFRKKCIEDRTFKYYAEQMYGPMTSMRRNLAFEERKRLKEEGVITSAFVAFPARLLVNLPGDFDVHGKKVYKLHTDFSRHRVERN